MGSFSCSHPVIAIDTEDDQQEEHAGKGQLLSVQLVGERGERRYFRRDDTLDVREGAAQLRAQALRTLREMPQADLWACKATYDATNLGLVSRGVTATRASGGYTSWTHPDLGPHVLFDTRALTPDGVAKMGEAVGLAKLEGRSFDDPEYAMRDAEIVCKWVTTFRRGLEELHEDAALKASAGATAAGLWRAMGGKVAPLPRELHHAARDAYRGGRIEVARFGATGPAEVWDMRSAFPWAMRQGRFPVGAWHATRELSPEGIYDVTVSCRGKLGPLPVRCNGVNVYPVGRFRGVYWGCELTMPGVTIETMHAGWAAQEFENPFDEYVDTLWTARQAPEDSPIAGTAKLLLNSLYGIIGHSGVVAGLATVTKGSKFQGRIVAPDVVAWEIDKGASMGTNPAWSGLITARVRRRLYLAALELADRVVYMDTDSLFVVGHLGEELGPRPQGEGLGDWRIQSTLADLEVRAPKVYAARHVSGTWLYRAKGVSTRLNKQTGMTYSEEFIRYARTRWRAPFGVIEAAMQKGTAGAWRDVEKQLRAQYRGRFVRADGRTEPWDYAQLAAATSSEPVPWDRGAKQAPPVERWERHRAPSMADKAREDQARRLKLGVAERITEDSD